MSHTVSRPAPRPTSSTVRLYLRRSLDDDKQQESLETQRAICERFVTSRGLSLSETVTYTDDNRSGDDFTRPGLVSLVSSVKPGDLVVAYDDSRLGRDALLSALVIRQITRDKGARVFYAATGAEARSKNGTDDLLNVAGGLGAEGELCKIRQRTRDGVRARITSGYWSGVAPYGYKLVPDESTRTDRGCKVWLRPDDAEATIVRRIYRAYVEGAGYIAIAKGLNADGIPGPTPPGRQRKDRNGAVKAIPTTWGPDRVHDILRHPIYRGVVTFGRTITVKRGGRHVATHAADPETIIRQIRPELAIIDPALADAVDAAHARRAEPKGTTSRRPRHIVHPLSGWARCARCKGSITTHKNGSGTTKYVCDRWRRVGDCDVRLHFPVASVEAAIVGELVAKVLSDETIAEARAAVRAALVAEAERLRGMQGTDTAAAEAELATLRVQKERAVKLALAMDDDADVVANLRAIKDRIVAVEKHLAAARSTAGLDEITMRRVEAEAVVRLERARDMVQDRAHLRDALSALFPTGLTFHPDGDDWIIAGDAVPCVSAGGGSLPLPRVSRASYD